MQSVIQSGTFVLSINLVLLRIKLHKYLPVMQSICEGTNFHFGTGLYCVVSNSFAQSRLQMNLRTILHHKFLYATNPYLRNARFQITNDRLKFTKQSHRIYQNNVSDLDIGGGINPPLVFTLSQKPYTNYTEEQSLLCTPCNKIQLGTGIGRTRKLIGI